MSKTRAKFTKQRKCHVATSGPQFSPEEWNKEVTQRRDAKIAALRGPSLPLPFLAALRHGFTLSKIQKPATPEATKPSE